MPFHVAILLKPYIRLILDGRKTVESRLTKTPIAPFESIEAGQRIYFKASAGPFMATAVADAVEFHRDLTPSAVGALKRRLNRWVCGDDAFWSYKRDAKYATFVALREVEPIEVGPPMAPSRGPAWFVLPDTHAAPAVFDVVLTDGAIRNRYLRIARKTHTFEDATYGGKTADDAGRPIVLCFTGGRVVRTDVVDNGMVRWRGWGEVYTAARAEPGDHVRFVQVGKRWFRVRVVRGD